MVENYFDIQIFDFSPILAKKEECVNNEGNEGACLTVVGQRVTIARVVRAYSSAG